MHLGRIRLSRPFTGVGHLFHRGQWRVVHSLGCASVVRLAAPEFQLLTAVGPLLRWSNNLEGEPPQTPVTVPKVNLGN